MVVPLFNPVVLRYKFEKSKTEVEKVNTLVFMTFKRYLMINKNTSSELVCDMIEDYYDDIAARKKYNATEKYFARREDQESELLDKVKTTNYLRGIPNSCAKSSNKNVGSVTFVKIAIGMISICRRSTK